MSASRSTSSDASASSHDRYRSVRSRSASSVFPDRGRSRVWRGANASSSFGRSIPDKETGCAEPTGVASMLSYPSTTAWAFVPDIPKALTPARGGRSGWRGQSVRADTTCTGNRSQSICGLGSSKCRCFGIFPCFMARTALIRAAIPAAGSR